MRWRWGGGGTGEKHNTLSYLILCYFIYYNYYIIYIETNYTKKKEIQRLNVREKILIITQLHTES